MRKFLKALILVPLALVIIVFAIANRQMVTFTLDPFGDRTLAFSLPLFALAFILVILGVILGGVAAWLRQHKWRRAAHQLEYEVNALRAERDALKRALATGPASGQGADLPRIAQRPPAA
ncbi:MAG TPA: LapA family protein [Xanthobacteraceae bacterium]|nr:LapA family protein [Xanthobacteraceae bacterium]